MQFVHAKFFLDTANEINHAFVNEGSFRNKKSNLFTIIQKAAGPCALPNGNFLSLPCE